MKRSRSTTFAVFTGLTLAIALPCALTSCASQDDSASPSPPPPSLLDATAPDGSDANLSDSGDASQEATEWSVVPTNIGVLNALTAVWGSSKDDIWASGSGGAVLHWDGTTWAEAPLPTEPGQLPIKNTFHALWGSGPNDVWVASTTDLIFHSEGFKNGTASWKRYPNVVRTVTPVPLYAAWGTGPDDLRFGGRTYYVRDPEDVFLANQVIRKKSGEEIAWIPGRGTPIVRGFWGTSSDDIWLIGDNRATVSWQIGLTMHGARKGDDFVWTEVDSQASVVLRGIWGSSSSDIWAVGDQGTIRHFGEKATEWQIVPSSSTEALHAVWGSAANDVWAVGESGTILHWDGITWSTSRAAYPADSKLPHLYGIWGSGPTDVWIVGEGIVLRYTGKTGGSR